MDATATQGQKSVEACLSGGLLAWRRGGSRRVSVSVEAPRVHPLGTRALARENTLSCHGVGGCQFRGRGLVGCMAICSCVSVVAQNLFKAINLHTEHIKY